MKNFAAYLFLIFSVLLFSNTYGQTTFYSQGNGSWNNLSNWNDDAGGSGSNPIASQLIDGLNTFVIQNSDSITVNDSMNIDDLTVTGKIAFGSSTATVNCIVNGIFTINTSSYVLVSGFNATHNLYVSGGIVNNGTILFRNSSSQVVNTFLDGTQSISGTGISTFNNFELISGTITAAKNLDINGSFIVNTGTTFNTGDYTHTISGTLTVDGSFSASALNTIELDATLVQTVSTNITFQNLNIKGGGVTVLSGNITVNGDFNLTENTQINTDQNHTMNGNFTITDGSYMNANDGIFYFYGTSAQNIDIGSGNAEFDRVYFNNAGLKTINGNLIAKDYSIIYATASVDDNGDTWNQEFRNGLLIDGTCNFSGTITLKGGTIRKINDNSSERIDLGNGADIVIDGYVNISRGDSIVVGGNVSINSGYLVLNTLISGDTTDSELIGQTGSAFLLNANTNLYVRGLNNFPKNFDTYTLEETSFVRYDANLPQNIAGNLTLGNLYTYYNEKTVQGALTIKNNLYVYSTNNDSVHLDLGSYNHTIGGYLYENYGGTNRRCFITSTGDVTFNSQDVNQYIYARTDGIYSFNNLYITNPSPTSSITKRLYGDITVTGNFSVINSTDNELLYLIFDVDDGTITGGNQFSIGSNVRYRTSGVDNFKNTVESFASNVLNSNSVVRFDGGDQNIPGGITYGHLYIYGNSVKTILANLDINGDLDDTGNTPVFTTSGPGMTINIAGNWMLESNNANIDPSSSIYFDGANQTIYATTLPNIVLTGTGTKLLNGNIIVEGDLAIDNGIEFDADNRYISIEGNWDNSSTGTFHQNNGRTTFTGISGQNITIQNPATSCFYDLYIDKPSGDTIYLNSNVKIGRDLRFTQNRGDLHLNNKTLEIGGDWYIYDGCELLFDSGSQLHFNGSSTEQLIRNYNINTIYPDMKFSGNSLKRLYQNPFNIDGDFYLDGATVSGEGYALYVSGDWINDGGTFVHYNQVIFDGPDQLIDGTTFDDVVIAGTGIKKLNGNISLTGWLRIDTLSTLDASPDGGTNSYNITIEEHWYNNEWTVDGTGTGTFTPREGTISFIGGNSNIYSGDSIDISGTGRLGKQFYNLEINNNNNNNYTRLYPINSGGTKTEGNDLRVQNNFTANSGIFYTYWNNLYVGGDFNNSGGYFQQNEYYGANSTLTLEGGTGEVFIFNPGNDQYFRKTVINGGGEYQLTGNLEILGNSGDNGTIIIEDGILNLNHKEITMTSSLGDVIVKSDGKVALDSAAILRIGQNRTLNNQGGIIEIIGNEQTPAKVTSASGNYYFIQDSGQIAANYYIIENTRDSGLYIKGGTIDATNNLCNGTFNSGTGQTYVTLDGVDLGGNITVNNVLFNDGPTYNVQRLSGNGIITFQDASGTFAGESNENDGGNLIDWNYPSGKYWDGGAATSNWNDAANWNPDGVPDNTSNIYLNHNYIAGTYTVNITTANAEAQNIVIDPDGTAIDLVLNGKNLSITEDFTIKNGATFTQTNSTDTLKLQGNWFNNGTYNCNTAPVAYNLLTNTQNISNTDTIFQLLINGTDGILYMNSDLIIKDSISFEGGTMVASDKDLYVLGDWKQNGGIFDPGTGDVVLINDDTGQTQKIEGGTFYNLIARNQSTKEITSNISVSRYFTIESGAFVDGKTSFIFVGQRWYNYAGESGFDQTGAGTVIFNGAGNSYIGVDNQKTTIFNNVIIQGSGTKYVTDSLKLKGDLVNQNGTNLYLYDDVQIIGTTAENTFSVTGGTIYLLGENNFPQSFETISLVGGIVDYYSNSNQTIYPTTYYDLRVRRINAGNLNTKTLSGDIEVLDDIIINDTDTELDAAGYEIILNDAITLPTGGRQIAWNGGKISHVGGNWGIDADLTEFNEITKKGTGWITLYSDINVTGNVVFFDETYLNMSTHKLTCTVADKNFSMGSDSRLYSYIAAPDTAFPMGFASYSLDETNITYIRGSNNQILFTTPEYGILYLYDNSTKTVELDGDLIVKGNFFMYYDGIVLDDQGHDLYLSGAAIDLRNYTPTNTIYFNGTVDQNIYAGGSYTTLTLNNIDVSGNSTKDFNETTVDINGNIYIHSGATFSSNDDINFAGSTLTNEGTISHTYDQFTFDGADQTIDPGNNNDFYGVSFANTGTKTFSNNGIDVGNGVFEILDGITVDLGSLTHYIASTEITFQGTGDWNVSSTNLYFDRNGTQYIPNLTSKDVYFSTNGYKYLRGDISVDDLTIENNVRLRASETSSNAYDIILTGNWINNGNFYPYDDTVFFESNAVDGKVIQSNSSYFNSLQFNQSQTSARTYSLSDNMVFYESMKIGNGASLDLNGNTLTIGNNDANNPTPPYLPDPETIEVEVGGELIVDGGASLQFDLYDSNPQLNVYGTLSVIGDPGLNANVTRSNGYSTRGTEINIYSGGTIKAENYHMQYLAPTGLKIHDGGLIDHTNNFSNGLWSNIYTGTQYTDPNDGVTVIDTFIYIDIDTDVLATFPDIENVAFNHGGTPTVDRHFNIRRNASATNAVTLAGSVSGSLTGETYEMDPAGMINWPAVSLVTWTGNVSTNWFDAQNWNPAQVPDETIDVLIPLVSNNPLIYNTGATCASLEITNGILAIEDGVDTLKIKGNVQIGDNGILAVETDAVITVEGDWNIATDALFMYETSNVTFTAPVGSVVIDPRNAEFYNLTIDGSASYFYEGINNVINGDLVINSGQFIPNDANYNISIKGDYTLNGGEFVTTPNNGFVKFEGTDQTITDGNFNRVEFSNSGTKTLVNSFTTKYSSNSINNNSLIISENATLLANCPMQIEGNVSIASTATLNDGGQTHTANGRYWTGSGTYTGTGTVEFKGSTQYIYESSFNNLTISEPVSSNTYKYVMDNISVAGNCIIDAYSVDLDTNLITNTSSGDFSQNAVSRLYIKGPDNYPANFNSYDADITSFAYYNGAVDQIIRGAVYGQLYLDGSNTKTLEDDIIIKDRLYFYDRSLTLNANNKIINIGGNWYNQYSGTFQPGNGEVIFDGTSNDQYIYLGASVDNDFYKLTVDKDDNTKRVLVYVSDLNINNQLLVHSGKFYTYNGYNTYISGNMTAQSDGTFNNTGTYYLNKPSGSFSLQLNGSTLNNLTINSTGTCNLQDQLDITGSFLLESGTFNGNGQTAYLGDNLDVLNIDGDYIIGEGGKLAIGNQSTFSVKSGGSVEVVGGSSNIATVTSRSGSYYFNVESGATINAQNYSFKNMRSSGIKVHSGSTINTTNNFSNGSFSNPTTGGTCLWIETDQTFLGEGSRIENVSFPTNPGYGTINVRKNNETVGDIEFFNATGELSGADYENDPFNLIFWTGDVTLTWNGSVSSDWFNKTNWTSSGTSKYPDENSNVIIPSGTTNIPEIATDSAFAKTITIDQGAFLTINNSSATAVALFVNSDLTINGTLTLSSEKDTVEVFGNWTRGTNGIFNPASSTIRFKGVGAKSINNRNSSFHNLEANIIGSIEIKSNTTLTGDLLISNGDFDVTASNYDLTIGGDFSVEGGEFIPRSGKVTLNGSGSHIINSGGSEFYDLDIKNGTFALQTNDLTITRNLDIVTGSLNVTSLTLNLGDDSGFDDLSINGTLNINDNGTLEMGNNSSLEVYSGGKLTLIGSQNNEATLTHKSTGRYSVTINSGGTLEANYYKVQYLNSTGIWFKPGSILDKTTNNLSNGTFSFGESSGRYLLFQNNYTNDTDTVKIQNVYFNSGPAYNAKRVDGSTNGIIQFTDALGVKAGYFFEDDDNASQTGSIVWSYTDPILTWVGGNTGGGDTEGNRWDNPNNWEDQSAGPGVPSASTQVFINDVSSGSGKDPVLSAGTDTVALNVTIYSGAKLTVGGNLDLNVITDLIIAGTLEVDTGSESTIEVGGQYSNNGDFVNGGNSTILLKTTDNATISTGGDSFYNLTINSGGDGSGTAVFSTESALSIEGDLNITAGTVDITNPSHSLTIGGNFTNDATFNHGNSTITFNGNSAQSISGSGIITFYDLNLQGSGSKSLNSNINVLNCIDNDATLNANAANITIKGDWEGSGTFNAGTGSVTFNGTTAQRIKKTETFNNLIVNNTSSISALSFTKTITVSGELHLTDGIVETNTLELTASGSVQDYSNDSYINGTMNKTGDSDFIFPIGTSNYLAPIKISDFSGSSSTFSARYYDSQPSNRTLLEEGLNNVSNAEYWNLTRNSGSGQPKISLYWTDKVRSGISNVDVLAISNYNTSVPNWEKNEVGTLNITSPDSTSGDITSSVNFNEFGDITFGFTFETYVWDPTIGSSDWNDPANWKIGGSPASVAPSNNTNVNIPDIDTGTAPVLSGIGKEVFNLTIESSGALTIDNNSEIIVNGEGDVKVGSILTLNDNSTLTLMKDFTVDGTLISGTNSSLKFNGDIEQNIATSTCYNLIIDGTEDKILTRDIAVSGNVDIQSTLLGGAHTISLSGNWSNSGSFEPGTSTVALVGSGQQTLTEPSASGFYNLLVNNTHTTIPQIQLTTNTLITNTLTLTDGIIESTSTDLLSIASSGSVSGGNDDSFVQGPLQKSGITDFTFPIGRDTIIMPIGISGMGGSGNFVAEYFIGKYSDTDNLGAGIDRVSVKEYWDLDRTSGTAQPYVTLNWLDNTQHEILDPTTLLVAHYELGAWRDMGNGDNILNGDKSGYVKSSLPFTSFSPVTVGSEDDSNPLPIELTKFSAKPIINGVEINWVTASQTNNDYFTIERMDTKGNLREIGVLDGELNSSTELEYTVFDFDPITGTSYYRLKQTDVDGKTTVFDWVSVLYALPTFETGSVKIELYPNPGHKSNITVDLTTQESYELTIQIVNLIGDIVLEKKIVFDKGKNFKSFKPLINQAIPSGTYMLRVMENDNITVRKFIVK